MTLICRNRVLASGCPRKHELPSSTHASWIDRVRRSQMIFWLDRTCIRQLWKDFPSPSDHQNHSYSPIWGSNVRPAQRKGTVSKFPRFKTCGKFKIRFRRSRCLLDDWTFPYTIFWIYRTFQIFGIWIPFLFVAPALCVGRARDLCDCELVPQDDDSASVVMEITDGLFHACFVTIRQLWTDVPSPSGHQNHSYSPI